MSDNEALGATSLVITQGVIAFTTFLPRLSEIRRCDPAQQPEIVADVRMGEMASVTLIMGVSGLAANLTGDLLPLYSALLLSGLLVLMYEWTLARPDRMGPKPHPVGVM